MSDEKLKWSLAAIGGQQPFTVRTQNYGRARLEIVFTATKDGASEQNAITQDFRRSAEFVLEPLREKLTPALQSSDAYRRLCRLRRERGDVQKEHDLATAKIQEWQAKKDVLVLSSPKGLATKLEQADHSIYHFDQIRAQKAAELKALVEPIASTKAAVENEFQEALQKSLHEIRADLLQKRDKQLADLLAVLSPVLSDLVALNNATSDAMHASLFQQQVAGLLESVTVELDDTDESKPAEADSEKAPVEMVA